MPRGKPISDETYRDHLIAFNHLFKWLLVREKLLVNQIADAREAEGMVKIIQASSPTTALGLPDRAVLELLYSTGIRKGELVNLSLVAFESKTTSF